MFTATPLPALSKELSGRRSECQAQGLNIVSQETCLVTDSHYNRAG